MSADSPSQPGQRTRKFGGVRIGLTVAFLALAIPTAGFYLEENWRGARAWADCQRQLQEKGETLALSALIPPPVPDAQNLAMAPLFAREFQYQIDPKTGIYTFGRTTNAFRSVSRMPFGSNSYYSFDAHLNGWATAQHTDFAPFARLFRRDKDFPSSNESPTAATDVILALTRYTSFLDELAHAAGERPLTQFPVDWREPYFSSMPAPHHEIYRESCTALSLRASAELATGAHEGAWRDVALCLRLSRDMVVEPRIEAQFTLFSGINLAIGPIWEGLADRSWTVDELTQLQSEAERFDTLKSAQTVFRSERASTLGWLEYAKHHRRALVQLLTSSQDAAVVTVQTMLYSLIPAGWLDLNKVTVTNWSQDCLANGIDVNGHRIEVLKAVAASDAIFSTPLRPSTALARLVTLSPSMLQSVAQIQTTLDQVVAACALERFQLDHQGYPSRLDELVPAYLKRVPTDVVDGLPLRYHLTPDGRYQLYSVGWNMRDDGGRVVWRGSESLIRGQGDWVWQYAELQPPRPPEPFVRTPPEPAAEEQ